MSENAVGAVESILTIHAEHRPGALGTGLLLFNCKRRNTQGIGSNLCMVFYSVLNEFQAHFISVSSVKSSTLRSSTVTLSGRFFSSRLL